MELSLGKSGGRSILYFIVLVAFIVLNLTGMNAFGMQKNIDGKMNPCVFDTASKVCTMSPLDHFADSQNMLRMLPTSESGILLLSLLLSLALLAYGVLRKVFTDNSDLLDVIGRLYNKREFAFAYSSPLQEAFSQGILNPKLY